MKNIKRLLLAGGFNVRELGGYPINNYGMTKWHTFVRSADLASVDTTTKTYYIITVSEQYLI